MDTDTMTLLEIFAKLYNFISEIQFVQKGAKPLGP